MAGLTTDEKAALRTSYADLLGGSVNVYRSPAAAAGKIGAPTQVGTAIPIEIVPLDPSSPLAQTAEGLGGGRVTHQGYVLYNATLYNGDELRDGTVKYKVLKAEAHPMLQLVYLSELRA